MQMQIPYRHIKTGWQVEICTGIGELYSIYLRKPNGRLRRCKQFKEYSQMGNARQSFDKYVKNNPKMFKYIGGDADMEEKNKTRHIIHTNYCNSDGLPIVIATNEIGGYTAYYRMPDGNLQRTIQFNNYSNSWEVDNALAVYISNPEQTDFKIIEKKEEGTVKELAETVPQEAVQTFAQNNQEQGVCANVCTNKQETEPVQTFAQTDTRPDLTPFLDNLPYDCNRILNETKFLLKQGVSAKYEIGKRLILLREIESIQTFAQIVEEHFAGLSRRSAYNYISFTHKVAERPKIKEFAEGGDNWTKALSLLESLDEDELNKLEAGEPISGITLDEIDKLSFREVKTLLRQERDSWKGMVNAFVRERDEARAEVQRLKEEMAVMKEGHCAPERCYETLEEITEKVEEVSRLINSIPFEAARQDVRFIGKISSQGLALRAMVNNMVKRILEE